MSTQHLPLALVGRDRKGRPCLDHVHRRWAHWNAAYLARYRATEPVLEHELGSRVATHLVRSGWTR